MNIDIHLIVLLLGNLINCISGSRTCGFLQYKSIDKQIILQSRTNKIGNISFLVSAFVCKNCVENLASALGIQKENWGNQLFYIDNRASMWKKISYIALYFYWFLD